MLEPSLWRRLSAYVHPLERLATRAFAERYRVLGEKYAERPGPWRTDYFPYLGPIMDGLDEGIDTGKRGVVIKKSGQGGGSEAVINFWAKEQTQRGGPILYMISKDDIAEEFGRERFDSIISSCAPLEAKALRGRKGGESITNKRFVDGKLHVRGGRSVLNLQSQPYRIVIIDEVDSLLDEVKNQGDPIGLAQIRMDAFAGDKLLVAFAHPSTRDRGAGKLYYERSDQRRAFMPCVHCGKEFYFDWFRDVKAVPDNGLTQAQAERDARCYHYFAPCCGAEISDAQRAEMAKHTVQRSTLPPEEAAKRTWIGLHFSQLYQWNKPLKALAQTYIEALDSEPLMRVFVNKVLGEVYEVKAEETTADDWRRLTAFPRLAEDPHSYRRGQVPPGVKFLTAGTDARSTELHWAVWGWGVQETEDKVAVLRGWLIDYGVVKRPYSLTMDVSELRAFDGLIYDRSFPSVDGRRHFDVVQGFHDSGWQPLPVYAYVRERPGRAVAVKGASVVGDAEEVHESRVPLIAFEAAQRFNIGGEVVRDDLNAPLRFNTFSLKVMFYNMAKRRFRVPGVPYEVGPVTLPHDTCDDYIAQSASEYLAKIRKGGRDQRVWKHRGPNHYCDCNIYAYGGALNLEPMQRRLDFDAGKADGPKLYLPGMDAPDRDDSLMG